MNLELCFAYQSGSGQTAVDVALEWRNLLNCALTIFTDIDCTDEFEGILPSGVHVVNLRLSERVNRYDKHTTGLTTWSPWGTKSGPNYQFFRIIQHYSERAKDSWLLYLEPDTYCAVTDPRRHIEALTSQHPSAWIVGARPAANCLPYIDESLHDHINGACLINVGDPSFHDFLVRTWGPSVLWKIRTRPYYAYDCVTATLEYTYLPSELRAIWIRESGRFVRTATMLNLSNLELTKQEVLGILDSSDSREMPMQTAWFIHAKISELRASYDLSTHRALRHSLQMR